MDTPVVVWVVTVCLAAGVFVGQWQRARRRPVEPEPPAMARAVFLALAVAAATILAVGLAAGSGVAWDLTAEYLTQYTLSVDVVFVVAVTMIVFEVPRGIQNTALAMAALIALVVRGALVTLGWVVTSRWSWVVFLSGALMVFRAIAVAAGANEVDGDRQPRVTRLMRRIFPVTMYYDGTRASARLDGKRIFTPFFLLLAALGTTDLIFAPEPGDPYVLFVATALALLLLRPLYFLLSTNASVRELFTLGRLLAVVLVLVAVKMFLLGAAANGVRHLGPIPLPAGIAASVWISLLLAVLVTSAAIRVALHRLRDRRAATSSV